MIDASAAVLESGGKLPDGMEPPKAPPSPETTPAAKNFTEEIIAAKGKLKEGYERYKGILAATDNLAAAVVGKLNVVEPFSATTTRYTDKEGLGSAIHDSQADRRVTATQLRGGNLIAPDGQTVRITANEVRAVDFNRIDEEGDGQSEDTVLTGNPSPKWEEVGKDESVHALNIRFNDPDHPGRYVEIKNGRVLVSEDILTGDGRSTRNLVATLGEEIEGRKKGLDFDIEEGTDVDIFGLVEGRLKYFQEHSAELRLVEPAAPPPTPQPGVAQLPK